MNKDDEIEYHKFAPGEEPTVYTADICAEVAHGHLRLPAQFPWKPRRYRIFGRVAL
jgi:hypothetical protein